MAVAGKWNDGKRKRAGKWFGLGVLAAAAVSWTEPMMALADCYDEADRGQWLHDEAGYRFLRSDGTLMSEGWLKIGNEEYRFDKNGYVLSVPDPPDDWWDDTLGKNYDPRYPLKNRLEEFGLSLDQEAYVDSQGRSRWRYQFRSGICPGSWSDGAEIWEAADGEIEGWTVSDLNSVYNYSLEPDVIAILAGLPVDETDYGFPLGGTMEMREAEEQMRVPRGQIIKDTAEEVRKFLNSFDWLNASDREKALQAAKRVTKASYNRMTGSYFDTACYENLVMRNTQCGGFTYGFQLLARCMGMDCISVEAFRYGGPHGWNIIRIGDQLWEFDGTLLRNSQVPGDIFTEADHYSLVDGEYMKAWAVEIPWNMYDTGSRNSVLE